MVDQFYIEILMNLYFGGIAFLGFYFIIREIYWLHKEAERRRKKDEEKW